MSITDNLRIQHSEIIAVLDDISSHLTAAELSDDSTHVYGLLLTLSDQLSFHLKREDKALYPALFRHPDKQISKLAKKFYEEMGGISKAFQEYTARWPHAASIQDSSADFIRETKEIFATLCDRIEKENTVLYPRLEISQ
jgi:iron-sulfur cluster repair protein YtfE (RIC family)